MKLRKIGTNQFVDEETKDTYEIRGEGILSEEFAWRIIQDRKSSLETLVLTNYPRCTKHYIIPPGRRRNEESANRKSNIAA